MQIFHRESLICTSPRELFDWHMRPEALPELIPPWEPVEVVSQPDDLSRDGAEVELCIRPLGGLLSFSWQARHQNIQPPEQFEDVQVEGPFVRWEHTHRFEVVEGDPSPTCRLVDHIEYELPFGWVGWIGNGFVRYKLDRMFEHRHTVTQNAFE